MRLIYLAHPVGEGPERAENLQRARRWWRWALEHFPNIAILSSWVVECELLEETPQNRDRGLKRDLELVRHSDEVWLCGSWVSPGMALEANEAKRLGITVVEFLTEDGEPPDGAV